MFDPITASPVQLEAQLWHLTEQFSNLVDKAHKIYLTYGKRDPDYMSTCVDLDYLSEEIDTIESFLTLIS